MSDEDDAWRDDPEVLEQEELEAERERQAKEEQPRIPQEELEADLAAEREALLNPVEPVVEPNPDEPEPVEDIPAIESEPVSDDS